MFSSPLTTATGISSAVRRSRYPSAPPRCSSTESSVSEWLSNTATVPLRSPEAERIAWLDSIDRTVCAEITGGEFGGYTVDSPADTELLVPPPYDELYLHVLEARSAYVGGEIDRYNNATALLQNLWEAYARSYIRSHRPTRRELNYLGGDRI